MKYRKRRGHRLEEAPPFSADWFGQSFIRRCRMRKALTDTGLPFDITEMPAEAVDLLTGYTGTLALHKDVIESSDGVFFLFPDPRRPRMVAEVLGTWAGRNDLQRETRTAFEESSKLIKELLNSIECHGQYRLSPKNQCTWKSQKKVCLRPSQGREVRLRVRPGDSGSCWEYSLIGLGDVDMEAVRQNLELKLGPENIERHEVINPEQRPLQTNGHKPGTVVPAPMAPPVPAEAPDATAMFEVVLKAATRQSDRTKRQNGLQAQLTELLAQREKIDSAIDKLEDEILKIEEESEGDAEAKKARQLMELMQGLMPKAVP